MAKIYVVMRSTGEYSDRSESPICAYEDESTARLHVEQAGHRAREIEGMIREEQREDDYADRSEEMQRLIRRYFDKDPTYSDADEARYEELEEWVNAARDRHDAMRMGNEFDPGNADADASFFLYSVEMRAELPTVNASESS